MPAPCGGRPKPSGLRMPQGVVHVQRNQKPLGDNGRIWELGTCVCADPGKGKEHRNWRKAYASLLPFSLFCLGLATALSIGLSQSTLLAMCAHHVCSDILSLETPFLPLSLVRGWGVARHSQSRPGRPVNLGQLLSSQSLSGLAPSPVSVSSFGKQSRNCLVSFLGD